MTKDWSTSDIAVETYWPKGEIGINDIIQDKAVINYSLINDYMLNESYEAHKLVLEIFKRQAKTFPFEFSHLRVIDVLGYAGHFVILITEYFQIEKYLFEAYKEK